PFVARPRPRNSFSREIQRTLESASRNPEYEFFRRSYGVWRRSQDLRNLRFNQSIERRLMRNDVLYETNAHRDRRQKSLTRDEKLTGAARANASNHKWGDDGGNDPEFDLRKAELHRFDCDADVACCHQPCAAPKRGTLYARDDGFRTF